MNKFIEKLEACFWTILSILFAVLVFYGGYCGVKTLFFQDSFDAEIKECFDKLEDERRDIAIQDILIGTISQSKKSLPKIEKQVFKWIDSNKISFESKGKIIAEMLQPYRDVMTYDFKLLEDADYLWSCTSDDGKMRGFTWYEGWGFYNGYGYKLFIKDEYVREVDFLDLLYKDTEYELSEDSDEIHDLKIFTIEIQGKTYYMVQSHHMKYCQSISTASISIYTIENNNLVKQKLFRIPKETLSTIGIEYSGSDDERTWLFDYDPNTKTIYVPLVGIEGDHWWLTDEYLLYRWDGVNFKYVGIDKHWSNK